MRARLRGDELAQCLVLDLLKPSHRQRHAGVLEEQESPELGYELRVGGITSVHTHRQHRAVGRVRQHLREAARLLRREAHAGHVDAELVKRSRDLRDRRAGSRRPQGEMQERSDPPPQHERRDHRVDRSVTPIEGAERGQDHHDLTASPHRTRQERCRGRDHGGDHRKGNGRVHRLLRRVEDVRDRVAEPGAGDHEAHESPQEPRGEAGRSRGRWPVATSGRPTRRSRRATRPRGIRAG